MLPLIGVVACLALDRLVASRLIGLGAAAILLISALLVFAGRQTQELPLTVVDGVWLAWNDVSWRIALTVDSQGWSMALIAYGGGALGLLGSALALPSDLRGFGGLFASVLLALGGAAVGACSPMLPMLAFAPVIVSVAWLAALRASGTLPGSNAPLILVVTGGGAALVLLATLLIERADPTGASPILIVAGVLAAVWVLGGLPPAHTSLAAAYLAPAALTAVASLGLPLIGIVVSLRLLPENLALLDRADLSGVTIAGVLAFVIAAARAVWSNSLRQIGAAQLSAQIALIVVCAGCGSATFVSVAPVLAVNALISTLALALGVAALERRSGSDDVTMLTRHPESALHLTTIGMVLATSSVIGIPGTWGFWSRLWLFDGVQQSTPWAIAPLLAGNSLLALALVAPLVRFWRASAPSASPQRAHPTEILPLVVGVLLALMGVIPHAVSRLIYVAPVSRAPHVSEVAGSIVSIGATLLLIAALIALRRARERRAPSPGERLASVLTPDTIGMALYGLAWLAAPAIPETMQSGLARAALRIRQGLAVLGRRYYLAAVLFAMIVVILVFAAG
jgi:formate hydrogenlyase subunit 3/multisubunit Na+/H+ antiporter MnhD subunit